MAPLTVDIVLARGQLHSQSRLTMAKKPSKVEIVCEGEQRILVRQYADGTEKRTPIAQSPKKIRKGSRPYWYWELATGRRKFF